MTEKQFLAFSFMGKNLLWDEIIELIKETQESLWMQAASVHTKGEDRIHMCGQVDGVNLIYSLLKTMRESAREQNGLTTQEDLE